MPELRPYQADCLESVRGAFTAHDRVLVSMPTGTGKTVVLAKLIEQWPGICAGLGLPPRVLWLAHRDELVWQAAAEIMDATGKEPGVEKGEFKTHRDAKAFWSDVVVASIQTLSQEQRREAFGPTEFGLVICDEAHHVVAESWTRVVNYFSAAKLCGCTATVDRADEVSLGKIFQHVAYHYDILDAVHDGWLAPIRQEYVEADLDWSKVRVGADGDLVDADIDAVLGEEEPLHKIVAPVVQMAGERQTLIFCPSVRVAELVAEIIPRYSNGGAEALSGKTDLEYRRHMVEGFKRGEFRFLSSCALFLEGFDAPSCSCIVMARPTRSRMLYTQAVGRGLRGGPNCPIPGKTDLLVIDLVGASLKHKLVHSADLLGGKYEACVVEAANRWCQERAAEGVPADVMEALRLAAERVGELRAAERAKIVAEAKLKCKTVNPFLVMAEALDIEPTQEPGWWQNILATKEQAEQLAKHGINSKGLTWQEANQLVEGVKRRKRDGLCSYKQARILRSRGIDPILTAEQASAVMQHFAKRKGGFAFTVEDAVRVAAVKKRGEPMRYWELPSWAPTWAVSAGVEGEVRIGDGEWVAYRTKRLSLFAEPWAAAIGLVEFASGNYHLRVKTQDTVNLRKQVPKRRAPPPKAEPAEKPVESDDFLDRESADTVL